MKFLGLYCRMDTGLNREGTGHAVTKLSGFESEYDGSSICKESWKGKDFKDDSTGHDTRREKER